MTLEPGALHLMLDGLTAPLTKGEMVPATLIFAHAGRVAVAFLVTAPGGGHGNIDHTAKPPQGPPPWVAVTKPHTSGGVCTTCLRGVFAPMVGGDGGFGNCLAAGGSAALSMNEVVGAQSISPPSACYAVLFLAGFDTCQIRQRLPDLDLRPGLNPGSPPINRRDQSATGRLLRLSSGTRFSRVVWAGRF